MPNMSREGSPSPGRRCPLYRAWESLRDPVFPPPFMARQAACAFVMATINVVQSLLRLYGGKFSIREPKSARIRRLMPMPPSLAISLREHREQREQQRILQGATLQGTDLVFAHHDGSPLDPSTVSHTFGKIARRAGLSNIRYHDLRHAHASLMLLTGADPKVISERLGHSSIAITMDIYAHILPGLQEEAAIRFEEALILRVKQRTAEAAVK